MLLKLFRALAIVIVGLAVACLAGAQTPAPAPTSPPVQTFTISANAAGYGGVKGTQAISVTGAAVHLTEYISIGYDRTWNPTDSKQPIYNLGDVNVAYELASLLPGGLKKKLVFDTTNWVVTFQGSAGKVTAPGINRVAEGFAAYISRPINNNMQMTCGYRVLFPGHVLVKMPSVGINFTF